MNGTLEMPVGLMGRKSKNPSDDISVKIDRKLYRDIRALAGFHGGDAGPWLTEFLRPLIAEQMEAMAQAIQSRRADAVRRTKP